MARMIIADDEPVIINGLERLVDWKALGIEIVGRCLDGAETLEAMLSLKPDIALLDISMPGLTGLQVLSAVRENGLDTDVIFISGFHDFEFVRSALLNGARDYLLKPVSRDELVKAVTRCLPSFVARGEAAAPDDSADALRRLPAPVFVARPFVMADGAGQVPRLKSFSFSSALRAACGADGGCAAVERDGELWLATGGLDREAAAGVLLPLVRQAASRSSVKAALVVSPEVAGGDFGRAMDQVRQHREYPYFASYAGSDVLLLPGPGEAPAPADGIEGAREDLFTAMLTQSEEKLEEALESLAASIAGQPFHRKDSACHAYCHSLGVVADRLAGAGLDVGPLDYRNLMGGAMSLPDFKSLFQMMDSRFRDVFGQVGRQARRESKKEIMVALEYIEEHYAEPLALKILADLVGMNTYYFSSYFKKSAGVNFKDYLRNVRMTKAMGLAISTDMNVGEIAAAVGYTDVRVFSDHFAKTCGEKPGEYLKRLRLNGGEQ